MRRSRRVRPCRPRRERTGAGCPRAALAVGAAALVLLAASGCTGAPGSDGTPGAAGFSYPAAARGPLFAAFPPADPPQDMPSGISLSDDSVVVTGGRSVVRAISDDHLRYTLAGDAPGAAALAPGKVLVLAGIDAGRVTGLERHGDDVEVTLRPAAVTEVVRRGSIRWDRARLDPARAFAFLAPVLAGTEAQGPAGSSSPGTTAPGTTAPGTTAPAGAGGPAVGAGRAVPHRLAGVAALDEPAGPSGDDDKSHCTSNKPDAPPPPGGTRPGTTAAPSATKYSIEAQGFVVEITPSLGDGGDLDLEFDATKCPKTEVTGGNVELQMTLKGHLSLHGLEASGNLEVEDGHVTSGAVTIPLRGTLDLELLSGTEDHGSQFPAKVLINLPFAIEAPVVIGGLPFYVSATTNFSLQPSFATKPALLDASAHLAFDGEEGFSIGDGEVKPGDGQLIFEEPASPLDTTVSIPTVGNVAFVAAAQLPRLGFGLGTVGALTSKAGVWSDIVVSLGGTFAGTTSMIPCSTVSLFASGHAGLEWELGLKLGPLKVKVGDDNVGKFTLFEHSKSWWRPDLKACQV